MLERLAWLIDGDVFERDLFCNRYRVFLEVLLNAPVLLFWALFDLALDAQVCG